MKISSSKQEKIAEQILAFLYTISPDSRFTFNVAKEIARDEEFTKTLLADLNKKGLVLEVKKNPKGTDYSRRSRWRLSDKAYKAYRASQGQASPLSLASPTVLSEHTIQLASKKPKEDSQSGPDQGPNPNQNPSPPSPQERYTPSYV